MLMAPSLTQACTGDCNGDGTVTVDEILRGVNIALGARSVSDCQTFDRDGNSAITVDELLTAVDFVLRGCPAMPTFTSSPEPRATDTPPAAPTATALPVLTPTTPPGCGSLAAPPSFGEGFVDLTSDVEGDLVPVPTPPANFPPPLSVAFFNDIDRDGTMEVFVNHEGQQPPLTVLRYDPSTGKLARDTTAVVPVFDLLAAVVDLDSDGVADLFGVYGGHFRVAWGRGGGTFEQPVEVFPASSIPGSYASPYFDDFDGDGWLDFLTDSGAFCDGGQAVQVLFADAQRHWSRHDDLLPTDLRIGDGVVFTAPLAGVEQTAVVLGRECEPPFLEAPRFFFPSSRESSGLPIWSPAGVVAPLPGTNRFPDPFGAPMGAAVGDLDGDGRFELAISGDPVLGVWRGADGAPLPDVTDLSGMTTKIGDNGVELIPWSVLFVDLDRDGRLDTFVVHGDDYMAQELRHVGKEWSTAYWNGGGVCGYEISEALNITRRGDWRTLAVGDLEGDGQPDLAVGGRGEQPRILHNRIETGNQGFGLRLRGTTSNVYGIGARIDVTVGPGLPVQHRFVGGFYPPRTWVEPLVFVGLGTAAAAERVRITWPSGTVQELRDVTAGALHTIDEPPVITIEPASRHLGAESSDMATVHVTPRDVAGAVRNDAQVEVAIVAGAATLRAPAAWTGSEWQAQIVPPATAGSSVIEVRIDGRPLGIRPRIWFD